MEGSGRRGEDEEGEGCAEFSPPCSSSGINITAHSSAKYTLFFSHFSLHLFLFLPKYQPTFQSSSLVVTHLIPSIFSPLTLTNMLIFHFHRVLSIVSHEKVIPTLSLHLTHSLKYCFEINFSPPFSTPLQWSTFHLFSFFYNIYPLLSLFSLSVSPMSLK